MQVGFAIGRIIVGLFYLFTGVSGLLNLNMLAGYVHDMVVMTALQGSFFEVVPTSHDLALIGAAVSGTLVR